MSSEYPQVSIGSVARVRSGFAFKSSDRKTAGIPVVKIANVKEGRLEMDGCSYISELVAQQASDFLLEKGDILISMTGYVGDVARVREGDTPCAVNQRVGRFHSYRKDLLDPSYLFFHLRSKEVRSEIEQKAYGSAQPNISAGGIEEISIYLPELRVQKEIAHILGTLDDKIELNRKTNETLEAMAKALFKSWFVDFDPVRAKAEGRPTGLPYEISDLFPDSFEDSELGEIPSGWEVAELGDCELDIESGRRPKGGIDKNLTFGIPSIGAESIASVGQFDFSKTKWVDNDFANSSNKGWIQNFDVALYKDGGKPGEFRPGTALYGDGFPFERAMVNEHVFLLRSSHLGQCYLYYLFNFDLVLAQIIHKGSSKGAQPGLNQEEVRTSSFVKPGKRLLDVFNQTVEPSIKKQLLIGKQCQVLSQMRDTLLPKLISGEIRIPDAERMLEEVGV
jgi:type I restriction enzyme S subunit